MLNNIKLALTGRSDDTILKSDSRLHDADNVLQDLQRLLPKLEAALDENENLWASLGHNLTTTAGTLKSLFPATSTRMHVTLDALTSAGVHISKCRSNHPLSKEAATCRAELRAFNTVVDELRATFTATVDAFRSRERYRTKVDVLVEAESAARRRQTDREVARRIRNEQKLNQICREADVLAEKLQDQVDQTMVKKRVVVNTVVMTFLNFQHAHLAGDRMSPVIAAFSAASSSPHMRQNHKMDIKHLVPSEGRHDRSMVDAQFSWLDDDSSGSGGGDLAFTQHSRRSFREDSPNQERRANDGSNLRDAIRKLNSGADSGHTGHHHMGYPYGWQINHDTHQNNRSDGNNIGMARSKSRRVRFPDNGNDQRREGGIHDTDFSLNRRPSKKIHDAPEVEMEVSRGQHMHNAYNPVGFPGGTYSVHSGRNDCNDKSDNMETDHKAGSMGVGLYPRPC